MSHYATSACYQAVVAPASKSDPGPVYRRLGSASLDAVTTARRPGRRGGTETDMLSEREQRALSGIEQTIRDQDPRFVASMRRRAARRARGHDAVVVLATLTALVCFVVSAPGPGLVAALLAWVVGRCRPAGPPRIVDPGVFPTRG
jgi:Protein of unknown function (DUF3040)